MALDPYNLRRFTSEQTYYHPIALAEMQRGRKASCWAWYVLPTSPFLRNGRPVGSAQNRMYELADDEQARAYLSFEADGVNLRANYIAILTEAARHLEQGVAPNRLMGIDAPRLLASAKLFLRIGTEEEDEPLRLVCERVVGALSQPAPARAGTRGAPQQDAAQSSSEGDGDSPCEEDSEEEPDAKRQHASEMAADTGANRVEDDVEGAKGQHASETAAGTAHKWHGRK